MYTEYLENSMFQILRNYESQNILPFAGPYILRTPTLLSEPSLIDVNEKKIKMKNGNLA